MGADDLHDLFAEPAGSAQPMSYRQGVILSFNQVTLSNTVAVGGTTLTDVPILGVGEATLLTRGSIVGLMIVGSTWAIVGRMVTPGTTDAANAVSLLSSRTVTANVLTAESTTSIVFTDLATAGPVVNATIGPSGRAVVIVSARMLANGCGAYMSFDISGATTQAASTSAMLSLESVTAQSNGSVSRALLVEGLTPGVNTFTAKYQSDSGPTVWFSLRNLTVMSL